MHIIDSHVHIYAQSHIPTLSWAEDLPGSHPLKRQRSVDEYRQYASDSRILGFIFVESDRKYDRDTSDWTHPLHEVAFFTRIVNGQTIPNEGFSKKDDRFALAMVPWAPMFAGPQVLGQYVEAVKEICRSAHTFSMLKGFRFLLQGEPRGTMMTPDFISSLEWLHEHEFSFDLTIDCHSTGSWQIEETITMMEKLQDRGTLPLIVVDHCSKPDLCLLQDEVQENLAFQSWAEGMKALATFTKVYVKLSGLLSEVAVDAPRRMGARQFATQIRPWAEVLRTHFGPYRIMFGSDWPVCTVNGPDLQSWSYWRDVVAELLDDWSCSDDEKAAVWSGTAKAAYRLKHENSETRL